VLGPVLVTEVSVTVEPVVSVVTVAVVIVSLGHVSQSRGQFVAIDGKRGQSALLMILHDSGSLLPWHSSSVLGVVSVTVDTVVVDTVGTQLSQSTGHRA